MKIRKSGVSLLFFYQIFFYKIYEAYKCVGITRVLCTKYLSMTLEKNVKRQMKYKPEKHLKFVPRDYRYRFEIKIWCRSLKKDAMAFPCSNADSGASPSPFLWE